MTKPVMAAREFERDGFQVGVVDRTAGDRLLRVAVVETQVGPILVRVRLDLAQGNGDVRAALPASGTWEVPGQELAQKLLDLGLFEPLGGNMPDGLAGELRDLLG